MVIIDEDVDGSHEIEGDDERPEKRPYPDREKSQDRQQSGGEIAVRREGGETYRQIVANDAWKDEHKAEEAKTVQRRNGALRIDGFHGLEPGKYIRACTKQPRDIAQHEMQVENECRQHSVSFQIR